MEKLNFVLVTQAPMTLIVGLQPGMEAFHGVGGGINIGIVKIMKHIWQSIINKYYGALQVFVSKRAGWKRMNIILIRFKPFCVPLNKSISFRNILDLVDLGKENPQLLTSFSFRIGPEPAHPFSLNVIQTALEYCLRPDQSYCPCHRTFSIGSYETRMQPLTFKITKPGIGFLKGLLLNIHMSNDGLVYSIHKIQKAAVLVKVGGIVKYISNPGIIDLLVGRLFKPIILNIIKCRSTMTGKLLKLSDGTALSDPQFKPMLMSVDTVIAFFPDKGAPAA